MLLALGLGVVLWIGASFFIARTILVASTLEHERDDGLGHAQRMQGLLDLELKRLARTSRDWSAWDETYAFARGDAPSFVEQNIYDDVFANLKLDLMAFIAADGTPRLVRSVDAQTGTARDITPDVARLLAPHGAWLDAHRTNQAMTGFVATERGILAFAAQPIHRSLPDAPGDSAGTQVFGRYLGPEFMDELRGILRLDLSLTLATSPDLAPDLRAALTVAGKDGIAVAPLDLQRLGSYAVLSDLWGAPVAILRALSERSGYLHAREAERSLLLASLAVGLLAGLGLYLFMARRVLQPLRALDTSVAGITRDDGRSRVAVAGYDDEITRLGHSVNAMLDEIDAQHDAREARDAALAASHLKSEYLATLSESVRVPLGGVLGRLTQTLEHDLPPAVRAQLDAAYRAAYGLLAQMNELPDFSRVNAGLKPVEKLPFDLRSLVEDVTALFAARAAQHGLVLACVVDPRLAHRYSGDQHRLRQVLANLLDNALKFSQRGEIVVAARLGGQADGHDSVELIVRDEGIGFAPAGPAAGVQDLARDGEQALARPEQAGIGLAVCKQILTQVGGLLDIDSATGAGSRVRATVRLMRVADAEVTSRFAGRCALLACRAGVGRDVLVEYLEALGIDVTVQAADGLHEAGQIDVVLVDVDVGPAHPAGPGLPVIALVAHGTPPSPVQPGRAVLTRPVQWQALLAALDAVLA